MKPSKACDGGIALLCFLILPGASSVDWEFGQYRIGQRISAVPTNVRTLRDCLNPKDPLTCDMLLGDGIWYLFEDRRLVRKTIDLPSRAIPPWINPRDGVQACKARLERVTGLKFRTWTDDYGVVSVETRDLIRSPRGDYYNIVVTFRNGRMQDVTQTPLPDV